MDLAASTPLHNCPPDRLTPFSLVFEDPARHGTCTHVHLGTCMELCTKGADPHVEEALATDQNAYMYGNLLQTMMGRSLQLRALPAGHRGLFAAIFTIFAMNINYCKLAGRYIALQRDNILQGEDNTTALHTVPNSYMHATRMGCTHSCWRALSTYT